MKLLSIIILLFSTLLLNSQNLNPDSLNYSQLQKKELQYKLTAGTSYLSFGNNQQMFCSYFHPQASYSVNSRFRLNIGGMFVNTNLYGFQPNSEGTGYVPANSSQATLLTIGGSWQAGSRLLISASIMKNINPVQNSIFPISDIYSLNAEYKINSKLSIGVEINYIKTNSPILLNRNPYSFGNSFASPFIY